jgi:hypothetical protein
MEKAYFAKWERGREKPDWFVTENEKCLTGV